MAMLMGAMAWTENGGPRGGMGGGPNGGGAGEPMTSFDYAYKLEAVRDWLFAQSK